MPPQADLHEQLRVKDGQSPAEPGEVLRDAVSAPTVGRSSRPSKSRRIVPAEHLTGGRVPERGSRRGGFLAALAAQVLALMTAVFLMRGTELPYLIGLIRRSY